MTTLTEPPLITPAVDVDELPALDQPDERVCDGKVNIGGPTLATCRWVPCDDAAEWIVHATFPCGHQPPITLHFCDWHKAGDCGCDRLMSDGYICNVRVVFGWMEPIR